MSNNTIYARELPEARLDAQYGVVFHERNACFYRRIRWAIAVTQLTLSSAAIAPLVSGQGGAAIPAIGLVMALLSIIDIVSDFAGNVLKHVELKRAYAALLASNNDLDAFDAELRRLDGEDFNAIQSLKIPAYNDVVRSAGRYDFVRPLTWKNRIVSAIA